MNGLARLADRLVSLMLRLHPLAGVSDFYAEMHATHTQVISEASTHSMNAFWQRILGELFDLPGVILRSWIFGRKAMAENLSSPDNPSPPTPWRAALLSLIPFAWIGPVMLSLSYLPFWSDPLWSNWIWPGETILIAVVFLASILLGIKRGFPRWSFPYVMGGVLLFTALVNHLLRYSPLRNMQLLWLLVIGAAWMAAAIYWKPFRPFWSHIRQDWTHLSYCSFALVLIITSSVDHDETSRLTALVLLPSLITLAGALIHLRSTTRTARILALVISLTLALPIHFLPVFDGMMGSPASRAEVFNLLFGGYFLLLGLLLAPALVGLANRAPSGKEVPK